MEGESKTKGGKEKIEGTRDREGKKEREREEVRKYRQIGVERLLRNVLLGSMRRKGEETA